MRVQSLGQEDPLEEDMATHSCVLAWRISWTEVPGGLQSTGSHEVRHDWGNLAHIQEREKREGKRERKRERERAHLHQLPIWAPDFRHGDGFSPADLFLIHTSGSCVLRSFSRVWLFVTLWTVACQAPVSRGFSRQEYSSGLPCPPPGDLGV